MQQRELNPKISPCFYTIIYCSKMKLLSLPLLIIFCAFASYTPALFSAERSLVFANKQHSQLNFSVANEQEQPKKIFQYLHDSSVGVEIGTKYQLSSWLQVEVDLQGQYQNNFSEVNLDANIFQTQNYSALANFGKNLSFNKHIFTPFAQLGVNYEQDKNSPYLPYNYQEKTLDTTKLQYGLGVRYSHNAWSGLGISFLYKNKSGLIESTEQEQEENLPLVEKNRSIGISIDLSF